MKRLQIYIDEEIDEALALAAAREGTSKAALIRACVAARYGSELRRGDPVEDLIGWLEGAPDDSASVDAVVYGA